MKNKLTFLLLILTASFLWAQGIAESGAQSRVSQAQNSSPLPLRKVVILTSGMAYYEHSGSLSGAALFNLPFRLNAVNDALKTLIINDSASANPSVTYQAENTLVETLRSLSVDLSDSPDFAAILSRLRGAEINITTAFLTSSVESGIAAHTEQNIQSTGRIIGVEQRFFPNSGINAVMEPFIILSSGEGIKSIRISEFSEITSIKFTDPIIERDINRALDLIASSRNSHSRDLTVSLPGTSRRNVTISYVIPSPVWKAAYRLDLGVSRPLFQGWAIVDNDSDTDWNNVELSLAAGRPSSFIQELYPPYHVSRPVIPLSIAGTAAAQAHDRSVQAPAPAASPMARSSSSRELVVQESYAFESVGSSQTREESLIAGGAVQTARGSDAGGQFAFTFPNTVNLNRRMSAMFPLVESQIEARKILIFSGQGRFPRLGAELTNTTGMKLPAGPITVFDGVYAGDALIEFWNEGEKRFISFGEDLSVTASSVAASTENANSVNISGGVMTINRFSVRTITYSFINSAAQTKQLIIEQSKNPPFTLMSPQVYEETSELYRFNVTLNANRETTFEVKERRPVTSRITLAGQSAASLVRYSTDQEIPANIRAALERAINLRREIDNAESSIREVQAQRDRLIADQERIRRNIEAAGNQTQQGQDFLRRLVAIDSEIDEALVLLQRAQNTAADARTAYETYIRGLNF